MNHACNYTSPALVGGGNTVIGNVYNPGFALQPQATLPYQPTQLNSPAGWALFPFTVYVEARLKI